MIELSPCAIIFTAAGVYIFCVIAVAYIAERHQRRARSTTTTPDNGRLRPSKTGPLIGLAMVVVLLSLVIYMSGDRVQIVPCHGGTVQQASNQTPTPQPSTAVTVCSVFNIAR